MPPGPVVFLFDVDNTLLDNDRVRCFSSQQALPETWRGGQNLTHGLLDLLGQDVTSKNFDMSFLSSTPLVSASGGITSGTSRGRHGGRPR
jgi:hypothetical protein